jgi:L-asparaginase
VVITHGTDTLEETAYFLNLVIKSEKPVILVGSMRPSTSLSADGPLNLYNAVATAANKESIGKGVLVVFNDYIYSARDVTKTHTTNVATFRSDNSGPIGHAHYGKVKFYYTPTRLHTKNSIFDINDLETLPTVDILYGYANQSALMTKQLVESGVDGIIYAGTGDGNLYKDSLKIMIEAVSKGTILVRSARVGSGFVVPNAEINDTEYGFVTADNLNPQKARILLMLALTKTKDSKEIQKLFWKY